MGPSYEPATGCSSSSHGSSTAVHPRRGGVKVRVQAGAAGIRLDRSGWRRRHIEDSRRARHTPHNTSGRVYQLMSSVVAPSRGRRRADGGRPSRVGERITGSYFDGRTPPRPRDLRPTLTSIRPGKTRWRGHAARLTAVRDEARSGAFARGHDGQLAGGFMLRQALLQHAIEDLEGYRLTRRAGTASR